MGALKAAVAIMGVMIVVGVAVLAYVIVNRLSGSAPVVAMASVLDEPDGTRIAEATAGSDRLVLRLAGGGPDRVVMLDLRTGRVIGRAALAH